MRIFADLIIIGFYKLRVFCEILICYSGDAYSALGNYAQAKTYYTAAVKLRDVRPKMLKAVCYTIVSRLYCTEENTLCRPVKVTGRSAILNLELASYLRRLSIVFSVREFDFNIFSFLLKDILFIKKQEKRHKISIYVLNKKMYSKNVTTRYLLLFIRVFA